MGDVDESIQRDVPIREALDSQKLEAAKQIVEIPLREFARGLSGDDFKLARDQYNKAKKFVIFSEGKTSSGSKKASLPQLLGKLDSFDPSTLWRTDFERKVVSAVLENFSQRDLAKIALMRAFSKGRTERAVAEFLISYLKAGIARQTIIDLLARFDREPRTSVYAWPGGATNPR